MKQRIQLSVVIPAYNAAKFIRSTIDLLQRELAPLRMPYEILIMENGSSDATPELAKELSKNHRFVRYHLDPDNPGKGRAVTEGIKLSKGEFVCFCDADLEIPPQHIRDLIAALQDGYQIAVASKRHPQSQVSSPLRRTFLSQGYNFLVRTIFRTGLYSHQDGLKAFRREAIMSILPYVTDSGWFWDTEVIALSRWKGYRIKEVPISCDYGWESTFDPVSGVNYFLPRLFSLLIRAPRLKKAVRSQK